MSLTWQEATKQYELIGGEIETVEHGNRYRGKIKDVVFKPGAVVFVLDWYAVYVPKGFYFRRAIRHVIIHAESFAPVVVDNYLTTESNTTDSFKILPKGVDPTDPASIQGLAL